MQKQWLGRVIFLSVVAIYISCSSQKSSTKNTRNATQIINDTLQTDALNGKWLTLLSPGFYDNYLGCKEKRYSDACDSVILDVQGSKVSLYVLCESEFNYIGVFKVSDSLEVLYFYMPHAVTRIEDRYRDHDRNFLRKYFYLNKHNSSIGNLGTPTCPCSLLLSNKLMEAKNYRKYTDTLIFVMKDSSKVIFQSF